MRVRTATRIPVIILSGWLTACSNGGWIDRTLVHDSAPGEPVDVSNTPDAVPRVEPLSRGGNPDSYVVLGKRYRPMKSSNGYVERGTASWYGRKFHGRLTSNGEKYDMYAMTAAHKTLPLPTYVRITNLKNQRSVVVRVNDRGPFHGDRLIDLSYAAASKLGVLGKGTAAVEIRAIDPRQPATAATVADTAPNTVPETMPITVATAAPSATSPAMATVPAPPETRMYLQVGAFSNFDNAQRLQQRLQLDSAPPVEIAADTGDNGMIYRVRLGPLGSEEHADQWRTRVIELGISNPRVVIEAL